MRKGCISCAEPLRGVAILIAAGVLLVTAALADDAKPADDDTADAMSKTHTLFMGADLSVEYNRTLYRVQGLSQDSFVIEVDGRQVLVPMDRDPVTMKIGSALKLTDVSASVSDLKGERTYTPARDPYRKFAAAQAESIALSSTNDEAARLRYSEPTIVVAAPIPARDAASRLNYARSRGISAAPTMSQQYFAGGSVLLNGINYDALQPARSDVFDAGREAGSLATDTGKEHYDAIDLSFSISAERTLKNPYVAVVASLRESGAKPGTESTWIYVKALDPISHRPTKVHLMRGGFPVGFELKGYQLHVYNDGVEVATNVAPRNVQLTRDEAAQYRVIEYVAAHKNATLPAVPMMGRVPADLAARLAGDQVSQTVYVRVSSSGQPVEAYVDEGCTTKIDDPYLIGVVRTFRFNPALNKGKPVEGVTAVNFPELVHRPPAGFAPK